MSNYRRTYTVFMRQVGKMPDRLLIIAFFSAIFLGAFPGMQLSQADVDLADVPMFTRIQPPPANIMILLDDSESMNCSVLVGGTDEGRYPNPDQGNPEEDGYCYIFENLGDSVNTEGGRYFGEEGRKYWQSQWSKVNVMYYNTNTTYEPWPDYGTETFKDADTAHPRPHPLIDTGKTLILDGKSFSVGGLDVKNAHYFVRFDDTIYLVVIDGDVRDFRYYTAGVNGTGLAEKVTLLTPTHNPPDAIKPKRGYEDERQNFANWYTYHRRREYMAKTAIARVIKNMEGVRIGILGVNAKIKAPLKPVKILIDGELRDESDILLAALYDSQSTGETPLKKGLETVGEYYKRNDGNLDGISGDRPYPEVGGSCQQSFTIVVTDGYYSDIDYNTAADNADGNNGQPYADSYKDTLADIAMYYYENDLSNFANQVPINTYDNAEHQHMVTYGLAFGVIGTLNPDDYELDPHRADFLKAKATGLYVSWPSITDVGKPQSIDDLWHAAVNGRGEFLSAANPQQLIDALTILMENLSKRHKGSAAAVTVNGEPRYAEVSDEMRIFQSRYSNYNNEWTGDVLALRIKKEAGRVRIDIPVWSAAEALENKDPHSRNILTYNGANGGILFMESQLTDAQKSALGSDVSAMVAYLRGNEVDGYRSRSQKLGDIVHSSPAFKNEVIYVGANDGMLHAFDVQNGGEEIFAYIPNLVFANLKDLADPAYTHKFFVDLTPTVKEGTGLFGGTQNQTILVGGLGKGGKGYFALDITEPLSVSVRKVLWEFPNSNTPATHIDDMGYSFSKPVVVRSYQSFDPWIVIFGNGYNSANGKSVLFILNPSNGAVLKKIEAGGGPDNGLSSALAVDVNLDDKVDYVYAGDLKGNLWKFDLTGTEPENWDVAYKDNSDRPQPLFQAKGPEIDPSLAVQPITTKPDVMFHPHEHGHMVCFGTGKFLGDSDGFDLSTQTLYGIWDYGDSAYQIGRGWSINDDSEYLGALDRGSDPPKLSNQPHKVRLLKQEAEDYRVGIDEIEIGARVLSDNTPIWRIQTDSAGQLPDLSSTYDNHAGWYVDLSRGERVIHDVLLRDGKLISIGFIPSESRCAHGGNSFFMEVNAFTGGRFGSAIFDINDDGSVGGGSIEHPGDFINIGTPENPVWIPPSGIHFRGDIQTPAVIGLLPEGRSDDADDDDEHNGGNDCLEVKIFSSSNADMPGLIEKCATAGVVYWKEVRQY